jgi:hypothetical protein
MVQLPKMKSPIQKRDDGSTQIIGLTGPECLKCSGLFLFSWGLMAAFTATMYVAALGVRGASDVFVRPGSPIL